MAQTRLSQLAQTNIMKIDSKLLSRVLDAKSRMVSETPQGNVLKIRLEALYEAFETLKESKELKSERNELMRYFPIALVALIQGFFRNAIKELINNNDEYKINASQKIDAQFSIHAVVAIEKQELTIGEIISNTIPLSSLDNIYSTLNTITDKTFPRYLKTYKLKCPGCKSEYTPEEMIPALFEDLSELFSCRNILAHETADNIELLESMVEQWFQSVGVFLLVSDQVVARLQIESSFPGLSEIVEW